jgi:hypothetical protein
MTTYVLGAGASHQAGYPLCSELWPHMTDWVSKTPSRNPRFQEAIDTIVRLNGPVTDVEAAFIHRLPPSAFKTVRTTSPANIARMWATDE